MSPCQFDGVFSSAHRPKPRYIRARLGVRILSPRPELPCRSRTKKPSSDAGLFYFRIPLPIAGHHPTKKRNPHVAHSAFSFTSTLRTCPLNQIPGGAFPKTSFKFHFLPNRGLVHAVAPLSWPNPHPGPDPDCRSPLAPSPCRAPRPIPRYQTGQADGDVETGAAPARRCRRYELQQPPTSHPRPDSAVKCESPCTAPDE